jgi:hypothetical protein
MSVPFDTLKLARRFEAAGIEAKQAGDMAEAIAEAMLESNLATKADVGKLETRLELAVRDLKIWTGSIAAAGVTIIAALQHFWK